MGERGERGRERGREREREREGLGGREGGRERECVCVKEIFASGSRLLHGH